MTENGYGEHPLNLHMVTVESVCVCVCCESHKYKHTWQKARPNRLRTPKSECVCAVRSVSVGIFHSFPKMLMVTIKFLMLPILFACILHKMRVFDHTNTYASHARTHLLTYSVSIPFWHCKSNNKRNQQMVVFHSQHLCLSLLCLYLAHRFRCVLIHML